MSASSPLLSWQQAKKYVLYFVGLVVVFVAVYFGTSAILGTPLEPITNTSTDTTAVVSTEKTFEGKIKYVDPHFYPLDNITYVLVDNSNNEIMLLKTNDQKLALAEGHFAKVFGTLGKTEDGKKDVLMVSKLVLATK